MSALNFNVRVDLLACFVACAGWIPQIHLRCDSGWPLDGQHYSWAFLIHVLTSIGRTQTWNQVCGTVCTLTVWATPEWVKSFDFQQNSISLVVPALRNKWYHQQRTESIRKLKVDSHVISMFALVFDLCHPILKSANVKCRPYHLLLWNLLLIFDTNATADITYEPGLTCSIALWCMQVAFATLDFALLFISV